MKRHLPASAPDPAAEFPQPAGARLRVSGSAVLPAGVRQRLPWLGAAAAARDGPVMTITSWAGPAFGMPTAMVSERERGVWRRYRLLPAATAGLILSAMVARYVIVLLAVLMQLGLAWCIYRTPLPAHPLGALAALAWSCFAFLGLGADHRHARGCRARGAGAGPGDFPADDHDRRGGRAAADPAPLGAASGGVPAGAVCGGGAGCLHSAGQGGAGRGALRPGGAVRYRRRRVLDRGAPLPVGRRAAGARPGERVDRSGAGGLGGGGTGVGTKGASSCTGGDATGSRRSRPHTGLGCALAADFPERRERDHLRKPAER